MADQRRKPNRRKTVNRRNPNRRSNNRNNRRNPRRGGMSPVMIILIIILTVLAVGAGVVLLILGLSGKKPQAFTGEPPEDLSIVDMSDPAPTDYGRLYYTPVDDANVTEEDHVRFMNNELLIVVQEGVSREQVQALAETYGAEIIGEIEVTGDYQLRISEAATRAELEEIVSRLCSEAIVRSASLNYVAQIEDTKQTEEKDGFYYGKKWQGDLQNFNNAKGKSWGLEAISTTGAWDLLTHTSKTIHPVKVGVVDGGFDVGHEDLGFAEVFYDNGANGLYSPDVEHGTHVCGTFAAKNQDTTGICGIYPYGDGRLYAVAHGGNIKYGGVNAFSENGNFWASVMSMKIAYSELIVRNVKVINQSQGFNYYQYTSFKKGLFGLFTDYNAIKEFWDDPSNFEEDFETAKIFGDFLNRMLQKGYDFVIVSAAGNDSDKSIGHLDCRYSSWNNLIRREDYPDVYDRIIVVGSINSKMEISSFSNGGDRVDIYAPGSSIFSTMPNNRYDKMSGTSMAAPHVAGVAAMVWSANNSLTGAEVKESVTRRWGGRCTSCHLVDAYLAVGHALGEEGSGETTNAENGGVLCYVVERDHEDNKIANAIVTLTNLTSGETYTTETDNLGHFEIMVPEGEYSLSVKAEGFYDYEWPDGNNFQNPIIVRNEGINYLDDWIKLRRDENYDEPIRQDPDAPDQADGSGSISDDENEFFDYLEDDYEDYDYGVPLEDMIAWRYYNGHLYALYDYAVSAHVMDLVTLINPSVHLVTITDAAEQSAVEELIAAGGREIYYTGNRVDGNGSLYTVNGEAAAYLNWYPGCPDSYEEDGYQDVVVIYRGLESPAENDADFGVWLEVLEDEYSYLDFFDFDMDGITRGVIIEWDDPGAYGLQE